MKIKLYNFFNDPRVAFPLMVLVLVLFFGVMFHFADKIESHRGCALKFLESVK